MNTVTEAEAVEQANALYEVEMTPRGGLPQRLPADSFAIDVRTREDGRHWRISVTYNHTQAVAPAVMFFEKVSE